MDIRLDAVERACVKQLADLFERGETVVFLEQLDLPAERRTAVLSLMEEFKVIRDVMGDTGERFRKFQTTAKASQVAREIAEEEKVERADLIEWVRLTVRRNPWTAWPLILLLAVVFVAAAIHQIHGAVKDVLEWFR